MLSDAERREIEEDIKAYADRKMGCVGALKIVQRHRGWVTDEALKAVADHLQMTPDELDSVATFYPLLFRRPVGRHVILICDSVSCYNVGYEDLLGYLTKRLGIGLGQTTEDGRFTLLPVACLGVCETAPAIMIDSDVHGGLEPPEKVEELLKLYE
ncbi:MAG: NADH-quinone oxidoreductase subunit NuoE [Nitrospiraceae bacterium]|nr:NADH-quinone oxidoreductase subunit NuoE [Nitrospiraceae bacterium]